MMDGPSGKPPDLLDRYRALSRGRKIIVIVFLVWAVQAVPKWSAAILADGETAAAIMAVFITPRAEMEEVVAEVRPTVSDPCREQSAWPCTAGRAPSCSSPC